MTPLRRDFWIQPPEQKILRFWPRNLALVNGEHKRTKIKISRIGVIMNDLNPSRKLAIPPRAGRFRAFRGVASERSGKQKFSGVQLAGTGEVIVCGQTLRFSRPGLTEEYSVSMDGLRQDFVVEVSPGRGERCEPPISPFPKTSSQQAGELVVKLAVAGAQVESRMPSGLVPTLDDSGRKIAYSRLRFSEPQSPANAQRFYRAQLSQ
jgi:hypothetical protein